MDVVKRGDKRTQLTQNNHKPNAQIIRFRKMLEEHLSKGHRAFKKKSTNP